MKLKDETNNAAFGAFDGTVVGNVQGPREMKTSQRYSPNTRQGRKKAVRDTHQAKRSIVTSIFRAAQNSEGSSLPLSQPRQKQKNCDKLLQLWGGQGKLGQAGQPLDLVKTFEKQSAGVRSVCFSASGDKLASADTLGAIKLWSAI